MSHLIFLVALLSVSLFTPAWGEASAQTDEAEAKVLYNRALELEVQDQADKSLIYYKDILFRYPRTQTAKAVRKKLASLNPAAVKQEGEASVVILRYQANADGTAQDVETGLVWMRCSVGQEWDGTTCSGEVKELKWKDADALDLEFAGHRDWRLPTIDELRTLVYCSNEVPEAFSLGRDATETDYGCGGKPGADHASPTLVQEVFPRAPAAFVWSASANAYGSNQVWGVNFDDGYGGSYGHRHGPHPVRLVRDGQAAEGGR